MPHDHSVQWRVYPPNNTTPREPGMPPLIPIAASLTQSSIHRRNRSSGSNTHRWKFDDNKFTKECEIEERKNISGNSGGKLRPNRSRWSR